MDVDEASALSLKLLQTLRKNVDYIKQSKESQATRNIDETCLSNKTSLIKLRQTQRVLTELLEKSKEELITSINTTDELHSKLEELSYEKNCLQNEISRIKKLDIQEIECLGISIAGEKAEILKKFEEERQMRSQLKSELETKVNSLKEASRNVSLAEGKLRGYVEALKRMETASEALNLSIILEEMSP
jgi:hypothetical protein